MYILEFHCIYLYRHQEGYVFNCVCLFVGLSSGLHKNYLTDFRETWMEDGSWPRIGPINFWRRCR